MNAQVVKRKIVGRPYNAPGYKLGYNYDLSKRTTLYAKYAHVNNANGANIALNGVPNGVPESDPSSLIFGISSAF